MNCLAKDIGLILVSVEAALGYVAGEDLFQNVLPSEPDTCVAVYDAPGLDPDIKYDYNRPGLMITARHKDQDASYTMLSDIADELQGRNNENWGSSRIIQIKQQGNILPLGRDENNNFLWSVNFIVHRTAV